MQCCVLPQEDDDNTRNKDLKNYNYNQAASSDEGSAGSPMDWGYDETAETESIPSYEEQGSEAEKIRFPVQDIGLVDNSGVGGSWGLQG